MITQLEMPPVSSRTSTPAGSSMRSWAMAYSRALSTISSN